MELLRRYPFSESERAGGCICDDDTKREGVSDLGFGVGEEEKGEILL